MTDAEQYSIVFVSSHLGHVRGGAEINDIRLGHELAALGHDIEYITQHDSRDSRPDLDAQCHVVTVPYLYGWSYNLFEPAGKIVRHLNEEWFRRRVSTQLAAVLRNADLVLLTGRPLLVKLKPLTDAPVVYAVRGTVHSMYHRYLERADGLVFWGGCEAAYEGSELLSGPHVALDPAVNTELFSPDTGAVESVESYDTADRTTLTFVGRLETVKRVDRIIEGIGALEDEFDLRLVIVGDGSQRDALETQAADVLTDTPVHFLGRVSQEEVPIHLNAADVFVMASEMENHPIALKEALACGTYSVAPDIGRIGSLISFDTGRTFDANTTAGLVDALRETLRENEHQSLSRTERAADFDGWAANAEAIIDLYTRLQSQ